MPVTPPPFVSLLLSKQPTIFCGENAMTIMFDTVAPGCNIYSFPKTITVICYTFENVCEQTTNIRNVKFSKMRILKIKCLSPLFVLYFYSSYDGRKAKVYMILFSVEASNWIRVVGGRGSIKARVNFPRLTTGDTA